MHLDDSVSRQVGQNDVFTVLLDKMGDVFGIGTSDTGFNQVVDGSFIGTVAIAEYLPAVRLESDELHRQDSQLIGTGETQERPRRDPGEHLGSNDHGRRSGNAHRYRSGWVGRCVLASCT